MNSYYVYVQGPDGTPLMPTKRYGWVRRALEQGKAVPVTTVPFTIRLTYEPKTNERQDVRIAPDMGRTNIGLSAVRDDGKCLFRAKCETRNKDIVKLMAKRKQHRQASRSGSRKARKRLAKRLGTTMKHLMKRKLPGYGNGYVTVKDIINKEARFNNRNRPAGWLTPTANQLLQTHEHLIELVMKILPISSVALEYTKFDFVKMDNPNVRPWEYGKGPLYGYKGDVMKALREVQGGKCLACGKPEVSRKHHIVPRSKGGSDTIGNLAGLCSECHDKLHTVKGFAAKVEAAKEGFNKKHAGASVVNQIMSRFTDWCTDKFEEVYAIKGYDTKKYRDNHSFEKDHDIDAYCIAAITLGIDEADNDMPPCYTIKQYRRHDRAIIKAQTYRTYFLNGKAVAKNRKPAYSAELAGNGKTVQKKQTFMALSEWFDKMKDEYGLEKAEHLRSSLKVRKSTRRPAMKSQV